MGVILLTLAALASSLCEGRETGQANLLSKVWKDTECLPGFSLRYHECWSLGVEDPDCSYPNEYAPGREIAPTKSCPEAAGGKWFIRFGAPTHVKDVFQSKFTSNGKPVTISQIGNTQYFYWIANIQCGPTLGVRGIYFIDDMPPLEVEARFKQHKVPPVFKEFVQGIKCDPTEDPKKTRDRARERIKVRNHKLCPKCGN